MKLRQFHNETIKDYGNRTIQLHNDYKESNDNNVDASIAIQSFKKGILNEKLQCIALSTHHNSLKETVAAISRISEELGPEKRFVSVMCKICNASNHATDDCQNLNRVNFRHMECKICFRQNHKTDDCRLLPQLRSRNNYYNNGPNYYQRNSPPEHYMRYNPNQNFRHDSRVNANLQHNIRRDPINQGNDEASRQHAAARK